MPEPETPLQQTQRHVHEGAMRIDRQAALIEGLQRDGHEGMVAGARELLAAMENSQEQGREHLRREEAKLGDGADEAAS